MTFPIRRAATSDLPLVMRLLNERIEWLATRGKYQWAGRDFTPIMKAAIASGATWLAVEGPNPVATVSLATTADRDFWTPKEQEEPALYMSKMATSTRHAGKGLGAALTYWALQYAQDSGVPRLRWDAWRDNGELLRYYRKLGATQLRTESPAHRQSGALFEMGYLAVSPASTFSTQEDRTCRAIPNQTCSVIHPYDGAVNHGAPVIPTRVHRVGDLITPPLYAEQPAQAEPLETPCDPSPGFQHQVSIYNPGDRWWAHGFFAHPITDWPLTSQLMPGQPQQIIHWRTPEDSSRCQLHIRGWHPQAGLW